MRLNLEKMLVSSLIVLFAGCGSGQSSSNNDQGVSFTLLGFNGVTDGVCDEGIFVSSTTIPISLTTETIANNGAFRCVSVQNNLCTQGVRADRAILSYQVDGASVSIPPVVHPISRVFGSSGDCAATNVGPQAGSSLPTGFNGIGSSGTIALNIFPTQILEYISLNRNSFPETPFTMNLSAKISAVTTSGQRIETNVADHIVVVTEDNIINPTSSDSDGLVDDSVLTDDGTTVTDDGAFEDDTGVDPSI